MIRLRIRDIPYVASGNLDGRTLMLLPSISSDGTFVYIEPDADSVRALPVVAVSEGAYISSGISHEDDYPLYLTDMICRFFPVPRTLSACRSVEDDLRNALAALHKYFVLLRHSYLDSTLRTGLLMVTEIEYAFSNHRSTYDRLNEVVRSLWGALCFNADDGTSRPLPELPDSFRRLASLSVDELSTKYRFPESLARFYTARRETFMALREVRDGIMHHGKTEDLIFGFRDGFALALDQGLASKLAQLGIWRDVDLKPNRLGSLLSLLAFLAKDAFDATQGLAQAIQQGVRCPPPLIMADYSVWYRSKLGAHFRMLANYLAEPWCEADAVLNLFPTRDS
jgi:hypothetical protein